MCTLYRSPSPNEMTAIVPVGPSAASVGVRPLDDVITRVASRDSTVIAPALGSTQTAESADASVVVPRPISRTPDSIDQRVPDAGSQQVETMTSDPRRIAVATAPAGDGSVP